MHGDRGCSHRKLVVGKNCRIEQCAHGSVFVTLGDVTLRFSRAEFVAAATAFGVALGRMDEPSPGVERTRLLC